MGLNSELGENPKAAASKEKIKWIKRNDVKVPREYDECRKANENGPAQSVEKHHLPPLQFHHGH